MGRSRSRGRRNGGGRNGGGTGGSHGGGPSRGGSGGGGGAASKIVSQPDRKPSAGATPPEKSGVQKAKDAIEKEREKARLKKVEKDKALVEKAQAKVEIQEKRREDDLERLDLALAAPVASATPGASEQTEAKVAAIASAPEPPPVSPPTRPPAEARPGRARATKVGSREALDEALVRKLFDFLDRSGKAAVSQRDVLMGLKKYPQVRRLFGLPVGSVEDGGASVESRLLPIQDAFESGSGLGEVSGIFSELREGSGPVGQTFSWEAFLAVCQRGALRANAAAAIALLPREHLTGSAFVPTAKWQVVPEGAACPGGLEYKMDMETGKTMGRTPAGKV